MTRHLIHFSQAIHRTRVVRAISIVAASLLCFVPVAARAQAGLVLDIRQTPDPIAGDFSPTSFTEAAGTIFFVGTDPVHGAELWATDETAQGTRLIKDIRPGSGSSAPELLTPVGGLLYFTADDGRHGREVWLSDGTAAGTMLAADPEAGEVSSDPASIVAVGDRIFFRATTEEFGIEPWTSDGTTSGTMIVQDINPGDPNAMRDTAELGVFNGDIFFEATNEGSPAETIFNRELWKIDGATLTAELLKNIRPDEPVLKFSSNPMGFFAAPNLLYFTADNGTTGRELWKSDGTTDGTTLVRDIFEGVNLSLVSQMTNFDGRVFFSATNLESGSELFTTDGTFDGTVVFTEIVPAGGGSAPLALSVVGDQLYFRAAGPDVPGMGNPGSEPWITTSTPDTAVLLKDIFQGTGTSGTDEFFDLNGRAIFSAQNFQTGIELYRSDGTPETTEMILEITPGSRSSVTGLARVGSGVMFGAGNPEDTGLEIWTTDGTAEGTSVMVDINRSELSSNPSELTSFAGALFFEADDGVNGSRLWTSDGSPGGTQMVTGFPGGLDLTSPSGLTEFAGALYFFASGAGGDAGDIGQELWRTDGTGAGTTLLRDINPGAPDSSGQDLVVFDGRLFFEADNGFDGGEMWVSDGTPGGTVLFKDINPNTGAGSSIDSFTVAGDRLYFIADNGTTRDELWVSDGTAGNTQLVINLHSVDPFDVVSELTAFGSNLVFRGRGITVQWEVWITDGTEGGTMALGDINPDPIERGENEEASAPRDLTLYNGMVYFGADDGLTGFELWRTDGATVELVDDIHAGPIGSNPLGFTVVDGLLYFQADDGGGAEVFVTDGTPGNAHRVADLAPGLAGSQPADFWPVPGTSRFIFTAANHTDGRELWMSDGTAEGTALVQDIAPGTRSSNPSDFTLVGDTIFFTAADEDSDVELWSIPASGMTAPGPNAASAWNLYE